MLIKLINFTQSLPISIINYYSNKQVYYDTMRKQFKKKRGSSFVEKKFLEL